jgi:uncharacterized Zn-finger protein/uncharacterized protein (DUF983 family)
MDVTDTKPLTKCCSRCSAIKLIDLFIPKRNICKECRNNRTREKYNSIDVTNNTEQKCIYCNNLKRRTKYQTNEDHRSKMIQASTDFKQKKIIEKHKQKIEEIGIDNKKCSCCQNIKINTSFRHNRLKCKDCERDEPIEKLKRVIRSRIISALNNKNKHTVEYLGCNIPDYLNWLLKNELGYTLDNRGTEWHIDHVIPLSHFNLEDEEQQQIAFNWRNTMPLSAKENLSKNNKIIKSQIEQHYKNLVEYHKENKLDLPQVYIDLFAT